MPIKILLYITQYLPLESVVALNLVSKSLLAALSLQVSSLKDNTDAKRKLIDLVEESLRNCFRYPHCPKLYRYKQQYTGRYTWMDSFRGVVCLHYTIRFD